MSKEKKPYYRGASHLLIIALLPALMIGVFYANHTAIKALLIALILFLGVFVWKKIIQRK